MAYGAGKPSISVGHGRLITGQDDCLYIPRRITRKYPILYMPPGGNLAATAVPELTLPGEHGYLTSLALGGALVVVFDGDVGSIHYGSSWGAPTIRTYMETVRTSIVSVATAAGASGVGMLDASKLVLAGASQGGPDCFGYAMDNPTKTQAIGLWAGVVDLIGFYTGTYRYGGDTTATSTNQPVIGSCWGVTYPTPLPSNADPLNNASSVTCPVLLGYSSADTAVTTASSQAMAAALPNGKAVRISATELHSDAEATDAGPSLVPWLLAQAT